MRVIHLPGVRWRAALLLGALSLFISLMPHRTLAAEGLNLVTSPVAINKVAKPGTAVTVSLNVQNKGSAPENLKATVMKFSARGEDGSPDLLTPDPKDPTMKWATVSPATLTVLPGEWKTANLTINLPKTAAFGYYYAVVFSKANQETVPNVANLHGSVATLVLLEAQSPNAKRTIDVESFRTKKRVYEYLPSTFDIRLRNSGNVHVAPIGNIFILRGKKQLGMLDVNNSRGMILPNSIRDYSAQWTEGYPVLKLKKQDGKVVYDSNGSPKTETDWSKFDPSKIRFGHYTARMVLAYNDGKRDIPIEGVVSFWVIPWKILGILILILLLVVLGLWGLIKGAKSNLTRGKRR